MKTHQTLIIRTALGLALALLALSNAGAVTTDISSTPLATASPTQVKPNIFYVLDDSGSMTWDFLPDTVGTDSNYRGVAQLIRNNRYNGVYYDPATTYTPPSTYNSNYSYKTNIGGYPSMTSANSSGWTAVPYDGFGVQTVNTGYTGTQANLFTTYTNSTNNSGPTQDLTSSTYPATYYTFIPGEYCQEFSLHTCVKQTATSASYPYPAYVRWCSSSNLATATCQATRFDTAINGQTYTYARYPGLVNATATVTVSGSGSTSLTGIKVGTNQIMSAATAASKSTSTVATRIATAINNCTSGTTGSCTVAGYWATSSANIVTIIAPLSLSATLGTSTPTPGTKSGNMTFTASVFAVLTVPGQNIQVTITPSTTSYPYPNTTTKDASRTDCAGTTCTYTEEMTNFANWWAYYRTRMQMTKSAASIAFSTLSTNYRLGYMSINNNTNSDFLNINDLDGGTSNTGQTALWYKKFLAAKPGNGTGLRVALTTAGRMYAGKLTGSQKLWVNESSGNTTSVTVTDPMQYSCQRNYTLMSTDGYWNEATSSTTGGGHPVTTNFVTQIDGVTDIGDQDGPEVTSPAAVQRPQLDGNATPDTLADVAQYYYTTDIRDATNFSNGTNVSTGTDVSSNNIPDKQQRMYTSTIGLGVSGYMQYQPNYASATSGDYYAVAQGNTATSTTCLWQSSGVCNWPTPVSNSQTTIDDLWHAAVNGGGAYYSAANPVAVKNGMSNFLSTVAATLGSSSGATVSSPNVTKSNNFEFLTTFTSQNWYGELAQYTIDPATGIPLPYAVWSESGTAPASATVSTTPPLLDNLAYTSRNIYTYDETQTPTGLTSLKTTPWSSLSLTLQNYFNIPAISGLSQLTTGNANLLPTAAQVNSTAPGTNNGAGGYNLLAYLRGDRSNENLAGGGAYYRQRQHVLGDMVNSQPAYAMAPSQSYTDPGYATFQSSHSTRQSMVYVGANDGMLHGFNGTTGAETFAYIPSMVLPNLYQLADMNYANQHVFFVDGSPVTGDVCVANCTSSTGATWETILIGGLGAGGSGYYALNVTDPNNPALLWEFTPSKTGGLYVSDPDLGLSFGTPIITKLSDGTWVVMVTSGYNNVSGSGHGIVYVLNASTGAIISKIDTKVGTPASPSGLAQISAYAPNGATNNTALRLYGGDLNGNLWRFDISGLTKAGGTVTPQLLATLADASGNPQPITTAPVTSSTSSGQLLVFVGTGQLLGLSDLVTTKTQSIYAIKDTLAVTAAPLTTPVYTNPHNLVNTCQGTTAINCFVQNTLADNGGVRTAAPSVTGVTVNFGTMNGWYADLPESGERINTTMSLQLGVLVFTSNVPGTAAATACSAGGTSYLNFMNYSTGLAIPGQTSVGIMLSTGNSSALANSATLTEGSSGSIIANTTLSNGSQVSTNLGKTAAGGGTRRISWRELMAN